MKKTTLFSAAIMLLAVSAFAAPPKKNVKKTSDSIKCAVMESNNVSISKATTSKMFADYKGNRYFFCCGGCPEAFKKDPAKFAKSPHIPTPKAKTAS